MASRRRSPASPDIVKDQIAVRCCPGQERKVREALEQFGKVEEQPSSHIFILHRSPDVSASKVATAIEALKKASKIAFATPVLRDPESGTRQVLTDEITLRLKPGSSSRAPESAEDRARRDCRQAQRIRAHAVYCQGSRYHRNADARRRTFARQAGRRRVRPPQLSHRHQTISAAVQIVLPAHVHARGV